MTETSGISGTRQRARRRQRAYRVRRDEGKIVVPVEVVEVPLVAALVAAGLLSKRDSDDPKKIGAALAVVVAGLSRDA